MGDHSLWHVCITLRLVRAGEDGDVTLAGEASRWAG
jgi:uncharacterized membrane protein